MKAPVLDLHRANRPGAVPGLLALVVAIVGLVATMEYLGALKEQGEALDERQSVIAGKEAKFRTISNAHRGANNARTAQLMAQQRYAIEPARDLIAGGWRPNIAFLSVDIVTASRQINMQFETRSAQEALSYVEWLLAQPGTENLTIKRQVEKPGPPVASVETTLQVTWKAFVANPVANAAGRSAPAAPEPAAASAPAPATAAQAEAAPPSSAHAGEVHQ
jgi:hypothetical protein